MKFEEIFKNDGIYVADGFAEGAAFRIDDGTLTLVQYKDGGDLLPTISNYPVHKSLFDKDYRFVYNRQSLFVPKVVSEEVKDCTTCNHDGGQSIHPSACTGCCADGLDTYGNWEGSIIKHN